MSGEEWLQGKDGESVWVSLRPGDMVSVSTQGQNTTVKTSVRGPSQRPASAKDQEKTLTESISGMLQTSDDLEQDKVEGVDKEEWDD